MLRWTGHLPGSLGLCPLNLLQTAQREPLSPAAAQRRSTGGTAPRRKSSPGLRGAEREVPGSLPGGAAGAAEPGSVSGGLPGVTLIETLMSPSERNEKIAGQIWQPDTRVGTADYTVG